MTDNKTEVMNKNKPTRDEVDIHRTIVLWLFLATLIFTLLLAIPLVVAEIIQKPIFTILPVVVFAGILGSFVSALKRIYSSNN
ncbi:hypothetical protein ACWXWU_15245 [Shewanella sp. A14]